MAYRNDDKTMAVVKFAEEHPEGKLKFCDIAEWVNREETWEKYPFTKRLIGISDYQFSRAKTKNGRTYEQECKLRFDEINAMRKEIAKAKLPLLITVRPEKFFELSYYQQTEAIREAQESYLKMQKEVAANDQIARSNQVYKKHVETLSTTVEELATEVRKTISHTKEQMARITESLNQAEVIRIMEEYEIPMDSINIVKVVDDLENKFEKAYDIRNEIVAFQKRQNNGQEEGGQTAEVDNKESSNEDAYWNKKTQALFSDYEEENDD